MNYKGFLPNDRNQTSLNLLTTLTSSKIIELIYKMVDFTKKRLQIFISSTYMDLIEERQAAVEAILTAGHFPAGMELFTAGDESQMDAIKQWIDESDIYLLILGARYGSIEPKSGKSYTHLEYEYALQQGKSLFACVLTEEAIDKKVRECGRSVLEMSHPDKLKNFRDLVMSKLIKMCSDVKDIKIASGETLAVLARNDKLVGWVRANNHQADMSVLADEIARLSRENADLRERALSVDSGSRPLGVGYDGILKILIQDNLLSFFLGNVDNLNSRNGIFLSDKDIEASKLLHMGLISRRENVMSKVNISKDGIAFINWLKINHRSIYDEIL